jgi:tetratricopeptide (TPR) repeat protein
MIQNDYLPLTKAFAAMAAGDARQAADDAEPALASDMIYPASYVQGLAYLKMNDGARAVASFKAATRSPVGPLSMGTPMQPAFYGPAQLGLARAYAMAGDKADAKKAYETLLATWKNGDADFPMLVAAKKEYAGL